MSEKLFTVGYDTEHQPRIKRGDDFVLIQEAANITNDLYQSLRSVLSFCDKYDLLEWVHTNDEIGLVKEWRMALNRASGVKDVEH